jgi:hypothetical protein
VYVACVRACVQLSECVCVRVCVCVCCVCCVWRERVCVCVCVLTSSLSSASADGAAALFASSADCLANAKPPVAVGALSAPAALKPPSKSLLVLALSAPNTVEEEGWLSRLLLLLLGGLLSGLFLLVTALCPSTVETLVAGLLMVVPLLRPSSSLLWSPGRCCLRRGCTARLRTTCCVRFDSPTLSWCIKREQRTGTQHGSPHNIHHNEHQTARMNARDRRQSPTQNIHHNEHE